MAALIVCTSLAVTMVVLTWLVFRIDSKFIDAEHKPAETEKTSGL